VDLVENRVLEPQRVRLEPVPGLAHRCTWRMWDWPGSSRT
jgi:hypothetical protein